MQGIKIMIVEEGEPVKFADWQDVVKATTTRALDHDIDPTIIVMIASILLALAFEIAGPDNRSN